VVDDGSTDNTGEVVKSYRPPVRYIYQKNAGDGPARNTGIAAAKSDWIAFLDHDDEWLPEKLAIQMQLLEKNPNLKWCAASYYQSWQGRRNVVGDSPAIIRQLGGKDYFDNYFSAVTAGSTILIMTSTMIVHKTTFDELGVFDSCWKRGADQDMWWRIAYRYPRIGFVSRPLSIMHLDVQSGVNKELALEGKRGKEAMALVARHLELARQTDNLKQFIPFARSYLFRVLLGAIYHGFKSEARSMACEFRILFPKGTRMMTYCLTLFPKPTSALLRTLYSIYYKLYGSRKELSRRYDHAEVEAVLKKQNAKKNISDIPEL
jgi:glycosyltransferase involved in cell wall biosynthesis